MTTRRRHGLRLCLVLIAVTLGSGAPKRVDILAHGSTGVTWNDEPVVFLVRVEPNKSNRRLELAAVDADGFAVQASREDLQGEDAPITRRVTWAHIAADGEVVVVAALYESGDTPVAMARRQIQVMARR